MGAEKSPRLSVRGEETIKKKGALPGNVGLRKIPSQLDKAVTSSFSVHTGCSQKFINVHTGCSQKFINVHHRIVFTLPRTSMDDESCSSGPASSGRATNSQNLTRSRRR
jgi:hypothetical protein